MTQCYEIGLHKDTNNNWEIAHFEILHKFTVDNINGSENWALTALQRQRIEAAEMELLRPLAGYILYEHKTNDYIRRELRITGILDKIDEYRRNCFNTCKECHKTESLWNRTTTDHKEGEQLEDRRNVGESSCNFGDGTDQRVQSLMFMIMMMMMTNN